MAAYVSPVNRDRVGATDLSSPVADVNHGDPEGHLPGIRGEHLWIVMTFKRNSVGLGQIACRIDEAVSACSSTESRPMTVAHGIRGISVFDKRIHRLRRGEAGMRYRIPRRSRGEAGCHGGIPRNFLTHLTA